MTDKTITFFEPSSLEPACLICRHGSFQAADARTGRCVKNPPMISESALSLLTATESELCLEDLVERASLWPVVLAYDFCSTFEQHLSTLPPTDVMFNDLVNWLRRQPDNRFISTSAIVTDAIGLDISDSNLMLVGRMMAKTDWVRVRQSTGSRPWGYIRKV
jgi:hypothetical protein